MQVEIKHYDVLDSTNLKANELATAGASEGTVVVADMQTAGRGRLSRRWESEAGQGLWFSIVLRPKVDPQYVAQVTLLAGVAVVRALRKISGNRPFGLKWPNDIVLEDKKICGILSELEMTAEGDIDFAIVGVGINVNIAAKDLPQPIKDKATSLFIEAGKRFTLVEVLNVVMQEFQELYENWLGNGYDVIRSEWMKYNCTLGNYVSVKDNDEEIFAGIAVDMESDGSLMVRNSQGETEQFNFGEVSIRRAH